MTAPTLPEFLLARIAEDEETAQALRFASRTRHDALADPKDPMHDNLVRALREAEAKRQILALAQRVSADDARSGTLLACFLALPYADHPDYREEWKP